MSNGKYTNTQRQIAYIFEKQKGSRISNMTKIHKYTNKKLNAWKTQHVLYVLYGFKDIKYDNRSGSNDNGSNHNGSNCKRSNDQAVTDNNG